MTNFFVKQAKAKKQTKLLLFLFSLAIMAIIGAIYLLVIIALTGVESPEGLNLFQPATLRNVSLAVILVIGLASLFKILQLGNQGSNIAKMLNGRQISPLTSDAGERRVLNVVEEIAIASGMKVPPVFLMDQESAINAFAAGSQPGTAAIGISQGALDYLSRDELQGVVAHEFSHIFNGDMKLNLRLIGLLHGILFLTLIGRILLQTRSSNRRGNSNDGASQIILIGLGLFIIGSIGMFFARLIKMAVSRQREYLADATAVQYTRYPAGIAGALIKIGGLSNRGQIKHPEAEEASHLFFANALSAQAASLLASHPPLIKRITAVLPSFDGKFPQPLKLAAKTEIAAAAQSASGVPGGARTLEELFPENPISKILATVGSLHQSAIVNAGLLMATLQPEVKQLAEAPQTARLLIFVILTAESSERLWKQQSLSISDLLSEAELAQLNQLRARHHNILKNRQTSLVLVDLAVAALQQMSVSQYDSFRAVMQRLVRADLELSLFEYVVQKIVTNSLGQKFNPQRIAKVRGNQYHRLAGIVIAGFAHLSNQDDQQAAYAKGVSILRGGGQRPAAQVFAPEVGMFNYDNFDAALDKLARGTDYAAKESLLQALLGTVENDSYVSVDEWILMKAVCDCFDCPVPLV